MVNDHPANSIDRFDELTPSEQDVLLDWIECNLYKINSFNMMRTSYGLKHIFERSENGFYIKNGAFKGAMLKLGFKVKNKIDINWEFNISKRSPAFRPKNKSI